MTDDIIDKKVSKILDLIINSKFITEISNGTLPKEKFDFYMLQDLLYLLDYSNYNKLLSSQCTSFFEKNFFFNEGIACQNEYKRHEADYKDKLKSIKQSPTCLLYTSYIARTLSELNTTNSICAFFSCPYIYFKVGKYLNSKEVDEKNPYYKWIKEYAGGEESINNFKKILNERFKLMTDEEIDKSLDYFANTSRMEYMFWESAYNFEQWPDAEVSDSCHKKEVEVIEKSDFKSIVNMIENEENVLFETIIKYKNISNSMISRLKLEKSSVEQKSNSQVNVSKLISSKLLQILKETSSKHIILQNLTETIRETLINIRNSLPIIVILNLVNNKSCINNEIQNFDLVDMLLLNWSNLNLLLKPFLNKEILLNFDDIVVCLMKISVLYKIKHVAYFDSFFSHSQSSLISNSYILYDGSLNSYTTGGVRSEDLSLVEFLIRD